MRVLGIDPGSDTTGWGVLEGDSRRYRLVEYGAIKCSLGQRFSTRLLQISNGIEEIITRLQPDACAIEDGFLATNVKVTLKLGHVRGVAILAAERAALKIHEYSPRRVKQTVVGYGNAEKGTSAGNGPDATFASERPSTTRRGGRAGRGHLSLSS